MPRKMRQLWREDHYLDRYRLCFDGAGESRGHSLVWRNNIALATAGSKALESRELDGAV